MTLSGHRQSLAILIELKRKLNGLVLYAREQAGKHELAENDAAALKTAIEELIDYHQARIAQIETEGERHG